VVVNDLPDLDAKGFYAKLVSEAFDKGFIKGFSENGKILFKPTAVITRAEAAAILHNMFYTLLKK
jgi:hypothetical protein